jgi:hypothetical protein
MVQTRRNSESSVPSSIIQNQSTFKLVLEASKFIMGGERRWNEAREFLLKDKIKIRRTRYVKSNSNEFNRDRVDYLVGKLKKKFPYSVIEEIEEEAFLVDLEEYDSGIASESTRLDEEMKEAKCQFQSSRSENIRKTSGQGSKGFEFNNLFRKSQSQNLHEKIVSKHLSLIPTIPTLTESRPILNSNKFFSLPKVQVTEEFTKEMFLVVPTTQNQSNNSNNTKCKIPSRFNPNPIPSQQQQQPQQQHQHQLQQVQRPVRSFFGSFLFGIGKVMQFITN